MVIAPRIFANRATASFSGRKVVSRFSLSCADKMRLVVIWKLMWLAWGWGSEAVAQILPSGFSEQVVLSGLTEPTVVQFASDGRVFVAEKSGLIKVFNNLGDTTPTIFADLRTNVYDYGKSGLLGMALDPELSSPCRTCTSSTPMMARSAGTAPTWGIHPAGQRRQLRGERAAVASPGKRQRDDRRRTSSGCGLVSTLSGPARR